MELNEKLQELRKQRGLTQEELAAQLYVSRTAISKWESGRGYPSIESLRAIAGFFSVSLDDLLSSVDVFAIAEEQQKSAKTHTRDLVFGLLDICALLLLFLPLFAARGGGGVLAASLLALGGIPIYLKAVYFAVVIAMTVTGILTLALQNCTLTVWTKIKTAISLALGVVAALLFTVSLQPYAAVFALSLLVIKAAVLFKCR